MIKDVKIKKLKVWPDKPDLNQPDVKPGFLMEIVRDDENLLKKFGQSTFTVAYKGMIKAFHWHKAQDDLWFFATGKAIVVLYDQRVGSPTFGETMVIEAGEGDYKVIYIPTDVVHGYKVISREPSLLFYHVTEPYNAQNPDEERIDPFDPKIGFDWNKY